MIFIKKKSIKKKKTHVIPIVQNVNNTIRTISEFPLIDARPVKAYAAAIVGLGVLGRTRTRCLA